MRSHIRNSDDNLDNATLQKRVANGAVDKLLVEGADYSDPSIKFKADFGYFHHFGGGEIEALFKIKTDMTTVYFVMKGKQLTRLDNFTEEMY